MANKKYAVWVRNKEATKEYIYASTHREASKKYRGKHPSASIHDVETSKA